MYLLLSRCSGSQCGFDPRGDLYQWSGQAGWPAGPRSGRTVGQVEWNSAALSTILSQLSFFPNVFKQEQLWLALHTSSWFQSAFLFALKLLIWLFNWFSFRRLKLQTPCGLFLDIRNPLFIHVCPPAAKTSSCACSRMLSWCLENGN